MLNINKLFCVGALAFCLCPTLVNAQSIEDGKNASYRHGFIQVQGGGSTTFTDVNAFDIMSPTFSFGAGYKFAPAVGARLHLNGLKAKGAFTSDSKAEYKYNYLTTNADLMLDMISLFRKGQGGPLSLYLIGGIGLNYAWDNNDISAAYANANKVYDITGAWGKGNYKSESLLSHNLRAGLMLDYNFSKHWSVGAEADFNSLNDRFNSKASNKDDWMFTAQVSLTYKFGHKRIKNNVVNRSLTTARGMGELEDVTLTGNLTGKSEKKQMSLTEMTEKGLQEIGLPTMKDGSYNYDKKLLAVKLGDNLPDIYLNVDESALPAFADKSNLEFRNVKYQLDENDEYKLVYADVYNRADGKTYTYNNLDGKLEYSGSTANFTPLTQIKTAEPEKKQVEAEKKQVVAEKAKPEEKDVNLTANNTNINVKTKVLPKTNSSDYQVSVTYTVEKEYSTRNDYASGKFKLEESTAGCAMMKVIKNALEGEYAKYMQPGKRLKVKITGSADATPIRSTIPYDGCYGEFVKQPVKNQGRPSTITVTSADGITANEQLAFLRAAGVKDYFEQNIPSVKKMKTDYEYDINVSKLKGSEFRKVSVILTFEDAF